MKQIRLQSENALFQEIAALKLNRKKRNQRSEFFVEGVRNINGAVNAGFPIKAFLSSAEAKLSHWATELLARGLAETHVVLAPSLMEKLSDKDQTSELLALVELPADDLTRLPVSADGSFVLLDRPSSPGNLGTVLRSCDAFGVAGVVVSGHAVDAYEPRVVRASMGSLFAVPLVRVPSQRAVLPWLERLRAEPTGLRVVGTSAHAATSVRELDCRQRTLFVFGNETSGVSAAYRDLCDMEVRIPMGGTATSLNVSCAVSIVLYEHFTTRSSVLGIGPEI